MTPAGCPLHDPDKTPIMMRITPSIHDNVTFSPQWVRTQENIQLPHFQLIVWLWVDAATVQAPPAHLALPGMHETLAHSCDHEDFELLHAGSNRSRF